jgi:phenylalanyl-tRNA synthetase beta chain
MKVSYNWLKDYIDIDITPEKAAAILTDTGLEVEGLEKIETIKGGLRGLVIGEVVEKDKHPDADRLSVTKVNVGNGALLNIVCGAPNVASGQKVVVATVGTTLFPTDGDSFKIKRSKIRGVESEGMICAEDEIGLGAGHDGIMVLDEDAKPGTEASDYFKVEDDWMIEIGLTPNRSDAMSHIGVARDLRAAMITLGKIAQSDVPDNMLSVPSVDTFKVDNTNLTIPVEVEDTDACPRYAGVSIANVKVAPSPDWLQNKLRAIGASPINNVVDITNFVLHETGQPLHAFDADKIEGGKVVVKKMAEKTKFTTLDDVERELSANDLMICNAKGGMCIAGVFGGSNSGVSDTTQNVFLESAYFNPVSVRKTAKRHGMNTDASFRFERGVDPNNTVYVLKRAAMLIKEIAGGEIASEVSDHYPNPIADFKVEMTYRNCDRLIGKEIDRDIIKSILTALDIVIDEANDDGLKLTVPAYRVDVQREVDVIEEILRIYGYNNIEIPTSLNSSVSYAPNPDREKVQNVISNQLSSNGFAEIMSNSLTKSKYVETAEASHIKEEFNVNILNPLSQDLDVMRQTLLFSGLEAIAYNQNRQNEDVKLYEFGKAYFNFPDGRKENTQLAIFLSGKSQKENWTGNSEEVTFYQLKGQVENILKRLGIFKNLNIGGVKSELFDDGVQVKIAKKKVVEYGWVKQSILKAMDIKNDVYYAAFDWDVVIELLVMNKIKYKEVSKFPAVRRDLSLLLDKEVKFSDISELAYQSEKQLLKEVGLFDVYEGKGLDLNKKSYAVSFILQDEQKTLTDNQIEKIMGKIQNSLESKLGATLR